MSTKKVIHNLRLISSFALLGAVIAGAFLGSSIDQTTLDIRTFGAVAGASVPFFVKLINLG
jgi:hypothetical protein